MKRHMLVVPAVVLVVLASLALSLHAGLAKGQARSAPAALNGEALTGEAAPAVTLANATRGVVFRTAAINANGTVASCFGCTSSAHLSTGQYEVAFNSNSQATNGWSRWVQVDTLTTGFISDIHCTTADRVLNIGAVFVGCVNSSGTFVDTSFFLFMAR